MKTVRFPLPSARVASVFCFILCLLIPSLPAEEAEDFRVLVFSKTAAFRHGSIEVGVESVRKLGEKHRFEVEATEDSTWFTPESLSRFHTVVFMNTSGTVFDEDQRAAFKGFIQSGGGYVGVHAASDTEYDWEWYGKLVGAYFKSHPHIQEALINVENRGHPAVRHLSETWRRTDEWYNFGENPRGAVKVLLTLDTDSFEGSGMKEDHPIAWYHEYDGGRAFYTGFGHTDESFAEEDVLKHLLGAIKWTAGRAEIVLPCCL